MLFWVNGKFVGQVSNGGSWSPDVQYILTPTLGIWYHVAFTFDDASNYGVLYFNGSSVASGTYTESIGYDSHPFMIGGEYDSGRLRYFFPGKIDEIRLYDRVLEEYEIKLLYDLYLYEQTSPFL